MNTLFKALSHPVRRRIIDMLRKGPLDSGQIAAAFDMSWPTVTGHLNTLRDAALVSTEKHGQSVRYRLEISAVEEALSFLMDIAGTGRAEAGQGEAGQGEAGQGELDTSEQKTTKTTQGDTHHE